MENISEEKCFEDFRDSFGNFKLKCFDWDHLLSKILKNPEGSLKNETEWAAATDFKAVNQ